MGPKYKYESKPLPLLLLLPLLILPGWGGKGEEAALLHPFVYGAQNNCTSVTGREHFDPRLSVSPRGRSLLCSQGRCPPLPRLDLVSKEKEGKGEALASSL